MKAIYIIFLGLALSTSFLKAQLKLPSVLKDGTGADLDPNTKELVILIHGWTAQSSVPEDYSRYDDLKDAPQWAYLFNILRVTLMGTSTRIITYHWEQDASTGGLEWDYPNSIPESTLENARQAAINAKGHGAHLGSLLNNQFEQVRLVHFIAHSAGAWCAREAAKILLEENPYVVVQVTLLDPFIPGEAISSERLLSKSAMEEASDWGERLYRLDNFYAEELPFWNPFALPIPTSGTQTQFNWRGSRHLNQRVDWGEIIGALYSRYYDYHSGPVEFYADTVASSIQGQTIPEGLFGGFLAGKPPFEFTQTGWYRSIFSETYLLPKIISQPTIVRLLSGRSATISISTARTESHQWYKDKEQISNTSANLFFQNVTASDAGDYVVRLANSRGMFYSDIIKVVVDTTVPPTITGVTPQNLSAAPLSVRQPIIITGSGITSSSTLLFYDGFESYSSQSAYLEYDPIKPNQLRYNISVGPNPGNWTVKIVNAGVESEPFPFTVQAAEVSVTGIAISGPSSVLENSVGQFSAIATFSNGTSGTVTANWSIIGGASSASLNASGQLSVGALASDAIVTVKATYTTTSGIVREATSQVSLVDGSSSGEEVVELIVNGNFSNASDGWERGGAFFADNRFTTARSPGGYAYLSNADGTPGNGLIGEIAQYVTIPVDATEVTLSYWYRITTQETGSQAYDVLTLQILPSGNAETIDTRSNLHSNSSYQERSFDISRFKGQRIFIGFVGTTDVSLPTTFRIDDVSVKAKVSSGSVDLNYAGSTVHDGDGDGVGNNDGYINPGEEIDLDIEIRNSGTRTATGVSAQLTTSSPYVTMQDDSESFSDITSGNTRRSSSDFDFTVSSSTPAGHVIDFILEIESDQGSVSRGFSLLVVSGGTPRIAVTGSGESIPNGSTSTSPFNNTDFDSHWMGESSSTKNFRIYNEGSGTLTLNGNPQIQIDGSSSFLLDTAPEVSIEAGQYTNFKINFDPKSTGNHEAIVRIRSNDSLTAEYTFRIIGEGKFRDITAPIVTITSPTTDAVFATASASLILEGQASDSVNVSEITWSNDRGGAGIATGTTSWRTSGINLQSGINLITVTARDPSNNISSDFLIVTYTPSVPEITVSARSLAQAAQHGSTVPNQTFKIRNTGSSSLNYQISVPAGGSFITVDPQSGTLSEGEHTITVAYSQTLAIGTHVGIIRVAGTGAINTPVDIQVVLTMTGEPVNLPYEGKSAVSLEVGRATHSATTQDGGYVIFGTFSGTRDVAGQSLSSNGSSEDDFYGVKVSAEGSVIWVKQYGGSAEEQVDSITRHPEGGWVVSGQFEDTGLFGSLSLTSAGKRDAFLARIAENGDVLWVHRAGGSSVDYGSASAVDASGNCFLVGLFTTSATLSGGSATLSATGTRFDIFVSKYTSTGELVWAKSFGGPEYDTVAVARADSIGNLYFGGIFEFQATFGPYTLTVQGDPISWDGYVAKLDSVGNVVYAKRFGEPSSEHHSTDYINFIALGDDGECYFGGSYGGPMAVEGHTLPRASGQAGFAGKIDAQGSLEWLHSLGTTTVPESQFYFNGSRASVAVTTEDKGVIVGGSYSGKLSFGSSTLTNAPAGPSYPDHLFFAKYDQQGNPQWITPVEAIDGGTLYFLERAEENNVVFMGRFNAAIKVPGLAAIAPEAESTIMVKLGPPQVAAPHLNVVLDGELLLISWPIDYGSFVLEYSTTLQPVDWTPITTAPEIANGQFVFQAEFSGSRKFFRLRKLQ